MTPFLRVEHNGRVALLTLCRPDRLNAIGSATLNELSDTLSDIAGDDTIGAIVVAGEGKAFSAGADIKEIGACSNGHAFAELVHQFTDTYAKLQELEKPSVAAIDGVALGGGFELALSCDLRVAASSARFGVPEIKLGLLPAAGGSQRLARLLPSTIAKQLLLTGDVITAHDAHRLGLVNELVEDGSALDVAMRLASTMASMPPHALAAAKRLVDVGGHLPLESGIVLERETVSRLFDTQDRVEGMNAFLEKRPAKFTGH